MSLISHADRSRLATRHVLPSLSAVPLLLALPHRTIVDFGTGAGLPGIPLALALPDTSMILVESRRRRVSFLRHIVRVLDLPNVEIAHTRLEDWQHPPTNVDGLILRAARTGTATPAAAPALLAPHGVLFHYHDTRSYWTTPSSYLWSGRPLGNPNHASLTATFPTRAPTTLTPHID